MLAIFGVGLTLFSFVNQVEFIGGPMLYIMITSSKNMLTNFKCSLLSTIKCN